MGRLQVSGVHAKKRRCGSYACPFQHGRKMKTQITLVADTEKAQIAISELVTALQKFQEDFKIDLTMASKNPKVNKPSGN